MYYRIGQIKNNIYQLAIKEVVSVPPLFFFILILIMSIAPLTVVAADNKSFDLENIIIEADAYTESKATGKSVIQKELIEVLPSGNGDVNSLLRVLPDVQLSDHYRTSLAGGEINAPDISISGGRVYQNQFLIDGMPNNNILDPMANSSDTPDAVSGKPHTFTIHSDIVEEIKVYDSNVPVAYGGFTGGAVVLDTLNSGLKFAGKLKYRTTRSDWTEFHVHESDEYDFNNSSSREKQPKYEKHMVSLSLDIPINLENGLLVHYSGIKSDIPLRHLGNSRTQKRISQNIFTKYVHLLSTDTELALIFHYAPYESKEFIHNALNSDYTTISGGFGIGTDVVHFAEVGEFSAKLFFQQSENSRDAPQHFRLWATTDTKDWGRTVASDTSSEGGYGDIQNTQQTVSGKFALIAEPLKRLKTSHQFTVGLDFNSTKGEYSRSDDTYLYKGSKTTPDIICDGADFDCVDGEQYFTRRTKYSADSVDATINRVALYAENKWAYQRLTVRPGLRITYDDFMNNTNVSPRLSTSLDVFGDKQTILSAGANRYYGHSLLAYKLREGRLPYTTETRSSWMNTVSDEVCDSGDPLSCAGKWQPGSDSGVSVYKYSHLKTPYSDELMVGLDQKIWGGTLGLKYVQRNNHDEFAKSYGPIQADGLRYFTMSNNGTSYHKSYRFSWNRKWKKQFISINGTYQQTNSSNEDYDSELNNDPASERVWYDGNIIYRDDLPRTDYNRPFVANLIYIVSLPYGVSFTNLTQYRGGYDSLEHTDMFQTIPTGEERIDPNTGELITESLPVYEKIKRDDAYIFDWKLTWTKQTWKKQKLILGLEIENVFNTKIQAGSSSTTYERGRQFWVDVEYQF